MNNKPAPQGVLTAARFAATVTIAGIFTTVAYADTFGSGANSFTIDFVTVGNAGNGDDAGAGGGSYSAPQGGVGYTFRMGVTEVSQDWITKATNLGLSNVSAGAWTGNRPAANMTWYEAAAFVNWLNTSTGHQAAYDLTYSGGWSMSLWSSGNSWQLDGENRYRHKDAYYYLPSLDEWYKSAFHQNDGVTANYWDYATGSNSAPTAVSSGILAGTAVYQQGSPADVALAGGLSPYGTMGQNGNIYEWMETAVDGSNDLASESRAIHGGRYSDFADTLLRSSSVGVDPVSNSWNYLGFRVASVPEPGNLVFGLVGAAAFLRRRRGA